LPKLNIPTSSHFAYDKIIKDKAFLSYLLLQALFLSISLTNPVNLTFTIIKKIEK
jgi:hypothetical protein